MTRKSLVVVTAGLRQPSSTRLLADRLAAATRDELAGRGVEVDVTVVELRDHAHDVVNALLTGFPSPALAEVVEAVSTADGLIAVTPIFNASYSGLFKSFVDMFEDRALEGMPVLLGATGGSARHSLALEFAVRPLMAYQRAAVTPTAVFAATDDWAGATPEGALDARIKRAGGELADLIGRSTRTGPADPFALTTSFEQLLAGGAD
jgi:FMN reductase